MTNLVCSSSCMNTVPTTFSWYVAKRLKPSPEEICAILWKKKKMKWTYTCIYLYFHTNLVIAFPLHLAEHFKHTVWLGKDAVHLSITLRQFIFHKITVLTLDGRGQIDSCCPLLHGQLLQQVVEQAMSNGAVTKTSALSLTDPNRTSFESLMKKVIKYIITIIQTFKQIHYTYVLVLFRLFFIMP